MDWANSSIMLVQSYWVIWLIGSFVVSILLGGVIFRNYEAVR